MVCGSNNQKVQGNSNLIVYENNNLMVYGSNNLMVYGSNNLMVRGSINLMTYANVTGTILLNKNVCFILMPFAIFCFNVSLYFYIFRNYIKNWTLLSKLSVLYSAEISFISFGIMTFTASFVF